jgi:hypothetical protein
MAATPKNGIENTSKESLVLTGGSLLWIFKNFKK